LALYENGGQESIGHYIMLKRHRCFVNWLLWTWEIRIVCQWQCQKWMLRVWNNCIPGCAARAHVLSRTLFRIR